MSVVRNGHLLTVGICVDIETESAYRIVAKSQPDASKVVVVTPNKDLATRLAGNSSVSVILEEKREGKTAAMNKLLGAVDDGILVYASGDIIIESGTVARLAEELRSDPACGAVLARVVVANRNQGLMGHVSALIWNLFNGVSKKLGDESKLAQANDMYALWRHLVDCIPAGTINDDTFIASTIRKKGFKVKTTDVEFQIAGPTNPVDYLAQRSRIILGHIQTIKRQKAVPTVFEFTIVTSPARNLRILASTIAKGAPGSLAAAAVAIPMEVITWCYAMLLSARHKDVSIWKQVAGTKNVLESVRSQQD
ncbi:MAG: hypothetical protein JRN62_04360 [Nitrososphaerota archaeon]|jgi:cellulose synthase/poly-beta-1,6-N-acetylglucosamine synthase-like glycosyltransferase|nr:hypothetical protein [Nitrososphaerota archaeon]MDG6948836.1 hypothetical protein [Nitrososphaerota archaeon]